MTTASDSNKKIAKNTIFLYFRSMLMMAIGLFSSRIILKALGIDDYGLYGAIGSIVAMFTIINGVLAAGTGRFLTFELGKGDKERLRKTFGAAFAMHAALAIILFILLESAGLWFLNNKMNIPEGREFAANVVFQLSILTCMLSLTQVPYNACIIAHEKMSVYAYVGIAEAVFKLVLIFALLYAPFTDNLIAYAVILAVWSASLQIWYRLYCRKRFEESNLMIVRDKSIYKGMLSYSLWDFFGQFCANGIGQGLNILLNIFFGVAMNSARAVAYQVEHALTQFSGNFMIATQPQIVKSYAAGDYNRFYLLISQAGKYSFFLLFVFTLPFFLEADYVLSLWLVEVPPYSSVFLKVIMLVTLFRVITRPVIQAVHAIGNIKFLNITSGLFGVLTYLPAVYILFKSGFPFWTMFIVQIVCAIMSSCLETWALYRLHKFPMLKYIADVYLRCVVVLAIASILPAFIVYYFEPSFIRLTATFAASLTSAGITIYYLGLPKSVRRHLISYIYKKLH